MMTTFFLRSVILFGVSGSISFKRGCLTDSLMYDQLLCIIIYHGITSIIDFASLSIIHYHHHYHHHHRHHFHHLHHHFNFHYPHLSSFSFSLSSSIIIFIILIYHHFYYHYPHQQFRIRCV